jgi:general secretion pathway protein J
LRPGPPAGSAVMARGQPENGQSGFTLIELLIALVVFGLLTVALTLSVRTGLTLRHAQTQRLDETADIDPTLRLLRALLTHLPMMPQGNRVVGTRDGHGFQGLSDRVSFIADLPTGLGVNRRAEMTLYVYDRRLILDWVPHPHEIPIGPATPPTHTELLQGIEGLQLAYWGALETGRPQTWQAQWESPEPPELIRVHLVFPDGDRRRRPDLIAASRS